MKLLAVPSDMVPQAWPFVQDKVEKGRKYWEDYYTEKDLASAVWEGQMQMWVGVDDTTRAIDLVCFTEIVTYPRLRILRVLWLAGRLGDGLNLLSQIEEWGALRGARRVEILGRPGWKRLLPHLGYGEQAVLYTKDLNAICVH